MADQEALNEDYPEHDFTEDLNIHFEDDKESPLQSGKNNEDLLEIVGGISLNKSKIDEPFLNGPSIPPQEVGIYLVPINRVH